MNYTKNDIDSLTTREYNSIVRSNFLRYYNQKTYYEDLTKYATLGSWILNSLGAEIDDIESLIGEYPVFNENVVSINRELNNEDLELIEMANKLGIGYTITDTGIRLGN